MLGQGVLVNECRDAFRYDLPVTHDIFRRKFDVKAVSNKVQIPPLLRQRDNAALLL